MKKFYFMLALSMLALIACNGRKRAKMADAINKMEVNGDEYNPQYLDSMNTLYENFVTAFPKDSMAPHYLLKSAQSAYTRGTQDDKFLAIAVTKLNNLLANYGDKKEAEAGLFLLANIYEDNKKDTVKAKEYYSQYIKKYPTGEYAESVKSILDGNLGKSAEEWLEKFQREGKIDSNVHVKSGVK